MIDGAPTPGKPSPGLAARVAAWPGTEHWRELDARALADVAAREGCDFATALLYARVSAASDSLAPDALPRTPLQTTAVGLDPLYVIVPGAFYREHPDTGADGARIRTALEHAGRRWRIAPIESVGSCATNGALLAEWLRVECGDELVVLISLSKGSADIRTALARPDAATCFARVAAWVSLGNVAYGTPLITWLRRRPWLYWTYRMLFWWRGRDPAFLSSLERPPLGTALPFLEVPPWLRAYHVIGFPPANRLANDMAGRWHRRLAPYGPNDGVGLLGDIVHLPGVIIPVWGADHYFHPDTGIDAVLHGLLDHIDGVLLQESADQGTAREATCP